MKLHFPDRQRHIHVFDRIPTDSCRFPARKDYMYMYSKFLYPTDFRQSKFWLGICRLGYDCTDCVLYKLICELNVHLDILI